MRKRGTYPWYHRQNFLLHRSVFFACFSLLVGATFGQGVLFQADHPEGINSFLNQMTGGDTLRILPGTYTLSAPVVVDKIFQSPVVIEAYDTEWEGEDLEFLLDLKGECIEWSGGTFTGGKQTIISISGDHVDLGFATVRGDHPDGTSPCGITLIGQNNSIHHCDISRTSNIGIDGNGGEIAPNRTIIRLNSDSPFRSVQNWHIYANHIHQIGVTNYGIHEGAMKLVPMVRGIYIYDNLIEDCEGQGIWLDRPEGDVLIYGNRLSRIKGKGIFYEISDEYPGTFGVYIIRNRLTEIGKQPIWIAASDHAKVIGNYASGELPSGAGAMPREINRVDGQPGTGRMMTLTDNSFSHNVFKPTAARNHLAIYDFHTRSDSAAGRNSFFNNYYITGHEAVIRGRSITISTPGFALSNSRSIARSSSHTGLAMDPRGQQGPDPGDFYFSSEESGIDQLLSNFPEVLQNLPAEHP